MKASSWLVVAAACAASAAQAQWTGKAELGIVSSTGNTEAKSGNTRFNLLHEGSKWDHKLSFAALYGENAEFSTAERYEAGYQSDYKITDRFSWFLGLRGEQDRFSGFAYQMTASTGAAYKFIDTPATQLAGSLGAGYRRSRSETLIKTAAGEVIDRIEGEIENDPVAIVTTTFVHAFNDTTKLSNKLLVEAGGDNTAAQNDIQLAVSMTQTLALAVGFGVRYNSDPPPLSETTDTLTTVNLVYNIE